MSNPPGFLALALSVLVVASSSATPAEAESARARFEVSGTSTVRGWMCPVEGAVEMTPGQSSDPLPGFPNGLQSVTATVQVQEFECPEEQMNEHLQEPSSA